MAMLLPTWCLGEPVSLLGQSAGDFNEECGFGTVFFPTLIRIIQKINFTLDRDHNP